MFLARHWWGLCSLNALFLHIVCLNFPILGRGDVAKTVVFLFGNILNPQRDNPVLDLVVEQAPR